MKIVPTLLIVLLCIVHVNAQTNNNEKAKLVYFEAVDCYKQLNYFKTIEKLEQTKKLLGSSNVRIQILLINSYYALQNYLQTNIEIEQYLAMHPQNDAAFSEINTIAIDVQQKLSIENEKQKDEQDWQIASKENTLNAYKSYNEKHPNGLHVKDSKRKQLPFQIEQDMKLYPNRYFLGAIRTNNYDLILKLADYGADVNRGIDTIIDGNQFHTSALGQIAGYSWINGGSFELKAIQFERIKRLLEHGANPNTMASVINSKNKIYSYAVLNFFYTESENITESIKTELVALLIKFGLDNDNSNHAIGKKIIFELIKSHSTNSNSIPAIECLLKTGIDPYNNTNQNSLIQFAKKANKKDIIQLFEQYKQ